MTDGRAEDMLIEDDTILHILRELQKLQLMISRLHTRGVVKDLDLEIVQIRFDIGDHRRLALVSRLRGEDKAAAVWDEAAEHLEHRLRQLESSETSEQHRRTAKRPAKH